MTNPNTIGNFSSGSEVSDPLSTANEVLAKLDDILTGRESKLEIMLKNNKHQSKKDLDALLHYIAGVHADSKKIYEIYESAINVLSKPIDYEEAKKQALEQLNKSAHGSYITEFDRNIQSIDRIFPYNLAEVRVPEDCNVVVPKISRWQRKSGIRDHNQANEIYMRLITQARDGLKQDLESVDKEYTLPELELVIPDDDTDKLLQGLVDGLVSYKKLFEGEALGDISVAENIIQIHDKGLREYKGLTADKVINRYVQGIIEANKEKVTELAQSVAREEFVSRLEERLDLLKSSLDRYCSDCLTEEDVALDGLRDSVNRKRRKSRRGGKELDERQPSRQVREITLSQNDGLYAESEQFPWLIEDTICSVLATANGANNVAVIDMRTTEVIEIEHKMAGYETEEKKARLLPIIQYKLQEIAYRVADGDVTLNHLKHLKRHGSDNEYNIPISYWGNITSNATRIYVTRLNVENMPDCDMKSELVDKNIDEIILFLGACDKRRQEKLLRIFIGDNILLKNT